MLKSIRPRFAKFLTVAAALLSATLANPRGAAQDATGRKDAASTIQEVILKKARHISAKEFDTLAPDVRKGLPLDPAKNIKACRAIESYLKDRGRYWASVLLEEGGKASDKRVIFNVEEGPVLRIRAVRFVGGGELAQSARGCIRARPTGFFGVGNFSTFTEQSVGGDVENLEKYYRSHEYPDAQVTRELIFNGDYSEVDVIFHIHEGKRSRPSDVAQPADVWFEVIKNLSNVRNRAHLSLTAMTGLTPEAAAASWRRALGQIIREVSIRGNRNVPAWKIMNHLLTCSGMTFDQAVLDGDVQRLLGCGLFKSVKASHQTTDDGTIVSFDVEEMPCVEEILFQNAYHLSDRELRNVVRCCGVQTMVECNPAANRKACIALQAELRARGYHWAAVTIKQGLRKTDRRVVFDVNEGPLVHVGSIHFENNKTISSDKLRACLDAGRALPDSRSVLRATLPRVLAGELEAEYQDRGYRAVSVEPHLSFERAYGEADLTFKVREGSRFKVRQALGQGVPAEALGAVTMKNGAFYDGNQARSDAERIAACCKKLGRTLAVKPTVADDPEQKETVLVRYDAVAAPAGSDENKNLVADVVVEGSANVPAIKVMSYLQTKPGMKYDEAVIHADANRLFESNLFKYVSIRREPTAAGVVVHVCLEKAPRKVREVVYKNARGATPVAYASGSSSSRSTTDVTGRRLSLSKETLDGLTQIRAGMPLDPVANLLACQTIEDYLHDRGRLWARVTLEEGGRIGDERVVFSIDEGPLAKVRSTTFTGNSNLASETLEKKLGAGRTCLGCLGYFDAAAVDKDVKALEELYRVVGFLDVKVTRELVVGKDAKQAELVYRIVEGQRSYRQVIIELTPNLVPGLGRFGGATDGGGGLGNTNSKNR